MPRNFARFACALIVLAALACPITSYAGPSPAGSAALSGTPIRSVYVRAAKGANPSSPQQVLIALHGMGGNGESFGRDLSAEVGGLAVRQLRRPGEVDAEPNHHPVAVALEQDAGKLAPARHYVVGPFQHQRLTRHGNVHRLRQRQARSK